MQPLLTRTSKEFLYQLILISILFLATVFDHRGAEFKWSEFWFFINYVVSALFISYVLLPRFFYPKKFIPFILGVIASLAVVILVEEWILEKIYYPDSRGTSFPGVIRTLLEVAPIILILLGFKFGWDAQQKQTQVERLNTKVAESQLQFLQSQINPHFLFNNLNNLYAYALENSPKTPSIILELSNLLRYMLYDCKDKWVPLAKEVEYLANFVQLQELQVEDRGTVDFLIKGDTTGKYIAPLLLVVFVENSFKHSTSSMTKDISIKIEVEIIGDVLKFHCANTFSGNGNTENLSKGIGLANVQTRLDLLYPNAHTLNIRTEENRYLVDLELQLN